MIAVTNLFSDKPQESISVGDLFGAMGGLMTAFAPPEQAERKMVNNHWLCYG